MFPFEWKPFKPRVPIIPSFILMRHTCLTLLERLSILKLLNWSQRIIIDFDTTDETFNGGLPGSHNTNKT